MKAMCIPAAAARKSSDLARRVRGSGVSDAMENAGVPGRGENVNTCAYESPLESIADFVSR